MNVLCAADKAHRAHSVTTLLHSVDSALDELLVVAQSEVVVSTEVKHFSLWLHFNVGALRRGDNTFFFVKAGFSDVGKFLREEIFHLTIHGSK